MRDLKRFCDDERGTTMVEFAIVGPMFLGIVMGITYMGLLAFATTSLENAVADAARCSSVKTTICTDSSSTISYARGKFAAAQILSPTYVYSTPACGHKMTASATYSFNFVFKTLSVPVSVSSCFP